MSQQVTVSVASDVIVIFTTGGSTPVTGQTFSDVTCTFRKNGGSFVAKTLDGTNFAEVGNGTYEITFTAVELDTVGDFTVVCTGAAIDQSTTIIQIVAATQATTPVSLQTCIINGHVNNLNGTPVPNVSVTALVLGQPSIEQSQAVMTENEVAAQTNANGEFFLTLVRLADVEVFIPETNFRRRFVVPNQVSANLFKDIS